MIRLPRISNFTDVDPFFDEPEVGVRLVRSISELGTPDLLILPGTKNTVDDLQWLRDEGFVEEIQKLRAKGTRIFGICGGFQMLGNQLSDPEAVEGDGRNSEGIGLLPVTTVFNTSKKTEQMTGNLLSNGQELTGFEIHLGQTEIQDSNTKAFLKLHDGRLDGAVTSDGRVIGTYFHGIFNNREFTREIVNVLRIEKGLPAISDAVKTDAQRREDAYQLLAEHVKKHTDMEKVYEIMNL